MPYVNNRWLGGLLTNWRTISDRIAYLHDLRRLKKDGQLALLPAKERITMEAELEKLEANLGGVADMRRQPDAIFIVDLSKEQLAVREAQRLDLPVIALVDTNCDPDEAALRDPGQRRRDPLVLAHRARVADGIAAGQSKVSAKDFAAKAAAASRSGRGSGGRGSRGRRRGAATSPPPSARATSRRSRASARRTPRSCAQPTSVDRALLERARPRGPLDTRRADRHRRRPRLRWVNHAI